MKTGVPKELKIYLTAANRSPFVEWLEALKDRQIRANIKVRLDRLEQGNPGDYKVISQDLYELRLRVASGYRIYFGELSHSLVLLLWGGDKSSQTADIALAQLYWADYKQREGIND